MLYLHDLKTLSRSNLTEYELPDIYDLENADFEPQGPFYLSFAQKVGGPTIKLGCGTGRLTIPIAQAGVDITGRDPNAPMLTRTREMSALARLDQRFDVVERHGDCNRGQLAAESGMLIFVCKRRA